MGTGPILAGKNEEFFSEVEVEVEDFKFYGFIGQFSRKILLKKED